MTIHHDIQLSCHSSEKRQKSKFYSTGRKHVFLQKFFHNWFRRMGHEGKQIPRVSPSLEKTPSKMDVAPGDKHWIKREFDCFGFYSMVFVEIQ